MAGLVCSAAKEKAQTLFEQESLATLTKRDFLARNAASKVKRAWRALMATSNFPI
jgi:hypothetical protein